MKRFAALLLVAFAAFGLAACGSGSSDADDGSSSANDADTSEASPITLGFAIGETGFMQTYDLPPRVAAEFAVEDLAKEGKPEGREFKFISADTKSKPELSGDAATEVISKGADIVITSCDFDMGSPAAIVAQQEGMLAFSTCAASTSFGPTGIGPLAFTAASAAGTSGAAMAEWAKEEKDVGSAFVLIDDTWEYCKQSGYGFQKRWEEIGGTLAGATTFKQEDQSIASQINEIKAANPDAIYLTSYLPGLSSAIKQIRAAGIDIPILSDADLDGDTWKAAVPGVSNVFYAANASIYGDDPDPKINAMVKRYEERTGELPDLASFLTGYAMMEAITEAIEGADGSTVGEDLQKQLETFRAKPFLLPLTFTEKYHITTDATLRIMKIQNGKSSVVEKWTPENTPIPPGA